MEINKDSDDYVYYRARYNVKKYRKLAKLTQQQLADKSEFTHQFIRNLESLKMIVRPRLDSFSRIAKALDIDIQKLFDKIDE